LNLRVSNSQKKGRPPLAAPIRPRNERTPNGSAKIGSSARRVKDPKSLTPSVIARSTIPLARPTPPLEQVTIHIEAAKGILVEDKVKY
jgi:hypothetical protein